MLVLMVVVGHQAATQVCLVQFADVFLQVEVAAKAFGTDFARVRLFVVVGVHVER